LRLGNKITVSLISSITAFGFLMNCNTYPVKAKVNNGSEWVDLNNDGYVDKDKLSTEEKEKSDKRVAEIDAYFEKIASKKAKLKAAKNKAKETNENKDLKQINIEINTLETEINSLKDNIHSNIGLVKVSDTSDPESLPVEEDQTVPFIGGTDPEFDGIDQVVEEDNSEIIPEASGASDVSLDGSIYYDVWNPGRWVITGEWDWLNNDWSDDKSGTGDVGKLEGFGLIVDEDTDIYSHSINTYWSWDGIKSTPINIYNDKSEDDNGWGWKWQDRIASQKTSSGTNVETYNSGSGIATLHVKFEASSTGSGDIVEATAKIGHTYSYTTITDVTFSNSGIGFTYSSVNARWSDTENWPIEL